jgi:hypothetical protein
MPMFETFLGSTKNLWIMTEPRAASAVVLTETVKAPGAA